MAWSIDSKLYRNTSAEAAAANRPPWRPMTYRLIFRTNNGTNPGMDVPDAHIYVRRIAYTPLPPAVPAGLLRNVWGSLVPDSGAGFVARCGVWGALWLAGLVYLRDARSAAAADEAGVAAWEAERAAGRSKRGGKSGGAHAGEEEEEEDAAAGIPLQPLRRDGAGFASGGGGGYGAAGGATVLQPPGATPVVQAQRAAGRLARMLLLTDDDPGGMMQQMKR
jgi:hypothetical protein